MMACNRAFWLGNIFDRADAVVQQALCFGSSPLSAAPVYP